MKKYLVISEVSKKQGYIFKTNKLKENVHIILNSYRFGSSADDSYRPDTRV